LIDLLHELPRAQVRAVAPEGARVDLVAGEAGLVPALVMPAPSRVIWPVQLTERAELTARVAVLGDAADRGVTIRIGISDNRSYDELLRTKIGTTGTTGTTGTQTLAWQPIRVDLSAFSGWRFSLFYHPNKKIWNLIVNADATPGGTAAWAGLEVKSKS
jgi:hypothetical protein